MKKLVASNKIIIYNNFMINLKNCHTDQKQISGLMISTRLKFLKKMFKRINLH